MTITVCGLNHKTAPIALRERIAIAPNNLNASLYSLLRCIEQDEAVILSTCNRTEIYSPHTAPEQLIEWLATFHDISISEVASHSYHYHQQDALEHLIRVTSGMDSMMLGETQIHGQMKHAYQTACEFGAVGHHLAPVFTHAFHACKRIRTETNIGQYAISIASSAADLACNTLRNNTSQNLSKPSLPPATVHTSATKDDSTSQQEPQTQPNSQTRCLLIGAGETMTLVAEHLQAKGIRHFSVANRTLSNANILAEHIGGQSYTIDQLNELLCENDIIISATNCPLPFLSKRMLERAMEIRHHKPVCLIDLAVPRDIEPECAEVTNTTLFNVDDLHLHSDANKKKREEAALDASLIIDEEVHHFYQWRTAQKASESIHYFREHMKVISNKELSRAKQLIQQGEDVHIVMEEFANRLLNKLLHQPTSRLRQAGIDGQKDLIKFTKALFHAETNPLN